MARVAILALGVLITACGVELREGVFACGADAECPAGWSCRQPAGRCYRTAGDGDAALADAGELDGGRGDAGQPDGGPPDGGHSDGGPPDEDRDGVPDAIDCAPLDPGVGATGSRGCSRPCGPGAERCDDGIWAECDAPTTCDCAEGATQTIACGHCGTQAQECTGNVWVDVGACSGAGECEAGTTQVDSQPCAGGCGTLGTQSRHRTCSTSCTWEPWTAFGACGSCAPATDVDTQACGNCGSWTRTRSCDTAGCSWGAWTGFGACTGQGACMPGDSQTDSCGSPTSCGSSHAGVTERYCSDSCTWGAWGFCDCS
jgi:hypothetical protein